MHRSIPRGALVAASLLSGAAWGQVLTFSVEFDGTLNGEPIQGSGSGSMDRQGQGNNFGSVDFGDAPADFTPFALDTLLTNVCPNGFQAERGSKNLWDLGGGTYFVERTFQWVGYPGNTVFANAEVTFDEDAQTLFSSMELSGNYNGPTDLVAIESYNVLWLPSSTEGEVFEAGTAVVRRANGELLIVQFATRYYGLRDSLQGPQFGVGDFDVTWDGQTMTVGWDGYFEVPAPGTPLLAAAGLMALSRRRRG